jgi:hypothetical protein
MHASQMGRGGPQRSRVNEPAVSHMQVLADGAKAYDGMGLHTKPTIGCEGLLLSYTSRYAA